MKYNKKARKSIALVLIATLSNQLLAPTVSLALTTGPSQPEVQSFEPVGTTDMVDMFSGDFVYNIPLLDVEGYPVNISYHGGVTMEQEASWVGLGWNINPGVITRTVRGVPDDFNGDTLAKELHIKDEVNDRVGLGVGGELAGLGDPTPAVSLSLSGGVDINISNYRGVSCDFTFGGGVNVYHCATLGVNIGVGSQTGAEIDYNADLSFSSAQGLSKDLGGNDYAGINFAAGGGYNTRAGLKDLNRSISGTGQVTYGKEDGDRAKNDPKYKIGSASTYSQTIPIGTKNYIPVITNSSTLKSIYGRLKLGGEFGWCLAYGTINGMQSRLHYDNDGSRPAFGYLNLQNAGEECQAILDFTRDKDGMFNKTMQYLPPASMTYDIYSVSGQGTGGIFRPFRNDFGSVYDPNVSSRQGSNSFGVEVGLGNIFEAGADYTQSSTLITSGPWQDYQRHYQNDTSGSLFENYYLKQGGELTSVNPAYFSAIGGFAPIVPDDANGLPDKKPGSAARRDPRGDLITLGSPSHISGIVQRQKDGRKYCYNLPAMNNLEKEATFSVGPPGPADLAAGLVAYNPGTDDNVSNNKGMDQYYSSTVTPPYAHSFLLTSVISADYVDITGNGPTDDDLGSYTKFNYALKDSDYRWKSPYVTGKAQYNPGFWSEPGDDKGNYVSGSRQEWMLGSIETKNFIAEFYTSKRNDGLGSREAVARSGMYGVAPYNDTLDSASCSYKLDSIKLYNKHDRLINNSGAVPIKTVFFVYDYSLCPGVPNTTIPGDGKLTLAKIYFRYGLSQKSMLSPYQFRYGYNPSYNLSSKDRWGNYKPTFPTFENTNYQFPYVNQNDTADNTYASAWSLSGISLPSGGIIQASYESDDYAYVQDKQATEMFLVQGLGNSPEFGNGHELYHDKNFPYLYAYFLRRPASELAGFSFERNYISNKKCMYYNFDVKLTGKSSSYEEIKGYASIEKIGACSDGIHGYVKFNPVTPTEAFANLNPATYTALNVSRYNLPQIIFPGSDPDASDFLNILAGLKEAFVELVGITRNPLINLVNQSDAKEVDLGKSFIRLLSVGMDKKGGGQRVKQLLFFDSWASLAGGNEPGATYGKKYDYTDNGVSSGVASYEPLVGGDENPLREPVPYNVMAGSIFPPNDPVDLYQETPIGESLYPPGTVGYGKVTVTSINANIGQSSQGVDVYQFYTAKDYPAKFEATQIHSAVDSNYNLFSQTNGLTATQGYSLVFNDMHGKPKSVAHCVYSPVSHELQPINNEVYYYRSAGGQLDNNVNCIVYQPGTGLVSQTQQLGIETDVTIDTRHKTDYTANTTVNCNLNVSGIEPDIIPIPMVYPWYGEYTNEFKSATVTKVTQQYGILDHVVTNNEGAITTLTNELFDPVTGRALVTSVNNEYQDKEYSVSLPAYWCYQGMGPAYTNIGYFFQTPTVTVDTNHLGRIIMSSTGNLNVGDELSVAGIGTCWFMGAKPAYLDYPSPFVPCNGIANCCEGLILPRYPLNTPGWVPGAVFTNVGITVINPGPKNMLNYDIENYLMLGSPVDAFGNLSNPINNLISIKARTYCDSNTRIPYRYIVNPDTINPYAIGERGVYRLLDEYANVTGRGYGVPSARTAGLFSANSLFGGSPYDPSACLQFPYNYIAFSGVADPDWRKARSVTKSSPYGKEVENLDPIGNYSTAEFGYDQELPVAVASNAGQGDVFADGFEDYGLLKPVHNLVTMHYSPFEQLFGEVSFLPGYNLVQQGNGSMNIAKDTAHTGTHSIIATKEFGNFPDMYSVPLRVNDTLVYANNRYNSYFPYGVYGLTQANEYLPFTVTRGKKYIVSFWAYKAPGFPAVNLNTYTLGSHCGLYINGGATIFPVAAKSNIIDGWQQFEVAFTVPSVVINVGINIPVGYYVDDIRMFPADANMKSFVYNAVNEKLMATLDENNFATMYEYDQEGNLVRVKKETEKGIMTVSESRSSNPRQ